jgi:hypothetical protein
MFIDDRAQESPGKLLRSEIRGKPPYAPTELQPAGRLFDKLPAPTERNGTISHSILPSIGATMILQTH